MNIDYFRITRLMTNLNLLHRIHIHRAAMKNESYFGQLPILEYVMEHDQCTQRELAETLQVSAPSIATSVKRMQKTGLLKKQTDPNDLRCTRISVTEKGREQAERCRRAFNQVDANMFAGFDQEECELFYGYLNRMIKNLASDEFKDKTMFSLIETMSSEKKLHSEKKEEKDE
jgi:DNA-binding MarR family transcriptional regulator